MQATFFQKFTLAVVAGFFAACLIWFYTNIIEKGDAEINAGYQNTTGLSSVSRTR